MKNIIVFIFCCQVSGFASGGDLANRVRTEFLHSWRAYERYAWGHDELRPISKTPRPVTGYLMNDRG